jgi:hypothetical protein
MNSRLRIRHPQKLQVESLSRPGPHGNAVAYSEAKVLQSFLCIDDNAVAVFGAVRRRRAALRDGTLQRGDPVAVPGMVMVAAMVTGQPKGLFAQIGHPEC